MMVVSAAAAVSEDYLESGGLYSTDQPLSAAGLKRLVMSNRTDQSSYSPVVLNNDWPASWRLLLISSFIVLGTFLNIFYTSSFVVHRNLRRRGNFYLACIGFNDMVITSLVMPISTMVLVVKLKVLPICYWLQALTVGSTYSNSLLYLMTAIENNIRICRTRACYRKFLSIPSFYVAFMIIVSSYITSGIGVYYGLNYDYCNRESFGNFTFRLLILLLFYGIPFTCIIILFVWAWLVVRARCIRLIRFKRAKRYKRDYAFTTVNLAGYLLFVLAWLPYLVVVNMFPNASDSYYYTLAWIGLSRSILTSILYFATNEEFREAYIKLFRQCFCKYSISNNHRHRKADIIIEAKKRGVKQVGVKQAGVKQEGVKQGRVKYEDDGGIYMGEVDEVQVAEDKVEGINLQTFETVNSCPEVAIMVGPAKVTKTSTI